MIWRMSFTLSVRFLEVFRSSSRPAGDQVRVGGHQHRACEGRADPPHAAPPGERTQQDGVEHLAEKSELAQAGCGPEGEQFGGGRAPGVWPGEGGRRARRPGRHGRPR
jgi:hypothetical protein